VTPPALLADTNILSYAHDQHTLWNAYHSLLKGHGVLIAAQTVAELRYGAFQVGVFMVAQVSVRTGVRISQTVIQINQTSLISCRVSVFLK
jgi:predicted nucleic acid-binding protein